MDPGEDNALRLRFGIETNHHTRAAAAYHHDTFPIRGYVPGNSRFWLLLEVDSRPQDDGQKN